MIDVLIVDDEERIREGIRNGVDWDRQGIRIAGTPGSAREALALIQKTPPHLILLDIRMSEMDGLEFLEILHDKYPNIKVILISGYNDFNYAQKAISLNAFCYLLKPLDSTELLAKVLAVKKIVEEQLEQVKRDEEFHRRFLENMPILHDNFLTQLALGKLPDSSTVLEKAGFLKLNLSGSQFVFVALALDSSAGKSNTDLYNHNLFKSAVMSTAENYFNAQATCYSFNLDDQIGLLIGGRQLNPGFITDTCRSLREWVNNSLGSGLTAGIGSIREGLSGIPPSCREALDALSYKLVLGRNEIIEIRQIPESEKTRLAESLFESLLKEKEEPLLFAVKTDDEAGAEVLWDEILQAFRKSIESDIKRTDCFVFLLSYFITKLIFALDARMECFVEEGSSIHKELDQRNTLEEIRAYGVCFLKKAAAIQRERQKKTTHHLVSQAIEYIHANIYDDISLTSVANSLYIHPNYLSKVFKHHQEVSFVEYVTTAKMNEAKKLLKSSSNKIYTIADMLQYKDINYFTKLFKKTFGVSPTEYRELA